jgi:Tol biopolymer transport system component
LWSPDGEYLVLSAIGEDGAPGIWVVPASGRLPPRFITQGIIAFWSWE